MSITRITELISFFFLSTFILVMVTFIIRILFFVQKKQRNFTSDLLAVKANYEKELYKAQMEIQEQTFKEISREIHDNVGQILSLAKLSMSTLDLENKDEASESIADISDILEKALDDLRHLSRTINSEVILKGGLKNSIESQVGYIKRAGKYNIHFDVSGEPINLNQTKEVILFRIVQEAVNNIIRHATATDICVSLTYANNFLELEIKDNGKGFCIEEQSSGLKPINGLNNMRQRAKLIEAAFEMESHPGGGTRISINTPY
jgi:signal transduction histidine kinase